MKLSGANAKNFAEHHRSAAQERNARIGPALAEVPRFALPDRTYYLVQGSLSALVGLRYPDDDGWRNPDLFWPDDRSWFVATDVDFWSLYVGGSNEFTSELSHRVNTAWEFVDRDEPLPDRRLNRTHHQLFAAHRAEHSGAGGRAPTCRTRTGHRRGDGR